MVGGVPWGQDDLGSGTRGQWAASEFLSLDFGLLHLPSLE